MTRRDAALLTLTLAGMWCLFNAVMLLIAFGYGLATPPQSVMAHADSPLQRLFTVLPIAVLSCSGIALLQSRRRFATWVFGANPSHDATAQIDAGDMRLLAVRVLGLLLFVQLARTLISIGVLFTARFEDESPLRSLSLVTFAILSVATALCFFRGGVVVRWLFAAGPGEGKSARYRDGLAFALGVIGAFYTVTFSGPLVQGIAEAIWRSYGVDPDTAGRLLAFFARNGADLAMVLIGIALFVGRRGLAAFWSKLHPMGADTP